MAVDWGEVRIGVAACDRDAVLAYPLGTVRTGEAAIAELAALAADHQVIEIVVGLPRSLSGTEGPAARKVREQAARLAAMAPNPRYYERHQGAPGLARKTRIILARMPAADVP
jgi:putative Holliday junction resolvase